MPTKPRPLEEVEAVFRTRFAPDLGRVSALFQTIPRIDTGHDGCEICLTTEDGQWMCSAFPGLDAGHTGNISVSICHHEGEGWGMWTHLKVVFDKAGQLVEVVG